MDKRSKERTRASGENRSPPPQAKKKQSNRSEEGLLSRKEFDRRRAKTRVNVGYSFPRWRNFKQHKGLRSDADVANYLLDCYYGKSSPGCTPRKKLKPEPIAALPSDASESDGEEDIEALNLGTAAEEREELLNDRISPSSVLSKRVAEDIPDMDEDQVNDLRNCVIDWAERVQPQSGSEKRSESPEERRQQGNNSCESRDYDTDGVCSDDDYVLSICLRTGGALKTPLPIDSLPSIAVDETVHDSPENPEQPEHVPSEQAFSSLPKSLTVLLEGDIVAQNAAICYESSLTQLANFLVFPLNHCTWTDPVLDIQCGGAPPFEVLVKYKGSATTLEWVCPYGHSIWKWNSQPTFKSGVQVGDFMMATNILLSGNNYNKVALLFDFMNVGLVSREAFDEIQDAHCVDSIKEFWNGKRTEVIDRLRHREHVVALADSWNGGPGHSTQYCTCTAIEQDSQDIISIEMGYKTESNRSSVALEEDVFVRTIDRLLKEIPLKEVCTDAHTQISALMHPERGRYKKWGLKHTLYVWHAAKSLAKRLHAAGIAADQSEILDWLRDIVDHFWYCCKEASTYEQFMNLWSGVLFHVTGQHEWTFGRCAHEPLPESSGKTWMVSGSCAHSALTEVVFNPRWLKDVPKFLNFRSTSDLETFQNHLLMYVSKSCAFRPSIYEARTLLAALDYNHHHKRPPRMSGEGKKIYRKLYNRKTRSWSVYVEKMAKQYLYIPDLQKLIVQSFLASDGALPLPASQEA